MKVFYPPFTDGEVSQREAEIIAFYAYRQRKEHGIAIEIGTFKGATTENIAANFLGRVVTVDLPPGLAPKLESNADNAKYFYAPKVHIHSGRVQQIWCDSADLKIMEPVAFAFIDGCHTYEYCKSDFEKVAPHMIPGGVILLHDYRGGCFPGVDRAIAELTDKHQECFWSHFLGTSLVLCEFAAPYTGLPIAVDNPQKANACLRS